VCLLSLSLSLSLSLMTVLYQGRGVFYNRSLFGISAFRATDGLTGRLRNVPLRNSISLMFQQGIAKEGNQGPLWSMHTQTHTHTHTHTRTHRETHTETQIKTVNLCQCTHTQEPPDPKPHDSACACVGVWCGVAV